MGQHRISSKTVREVIKDDEILEFRKNLFIKYEGCDEEEACKRLFSLYIAPDPILLSEYKRKRRG